MPEDAGGIAVVDVASWLSVYRGLIPDHVLAAMSVTEHERHWRERIATTPARHSTLVLTQHKEVVGFAATGPPRAVTKPASGELHALYLTPAVWGCRLGTRLHDAALDRLRADGFASAELWVLDANSRARRFYRCHGWADTGQTVLDQPSSGLLIRRLCRHLTPD